MAWLTSSTEALTSSVAELAFIMASLMERIFCSIEVKPCCSWSADVPSVWLDVAMLSAWPEILCRTSFVVRNIWFIAVPSRPISSLLLTTFSSRA